MILANGEYGAVDDNGVVSTKSKRQGWNQRTQIGIGDDRIGRDIERGRACKAGGKGMGTGGCGCVGARQGHGICGREFGGIEYSIVDGGDVEGEGRINTGKILRDVIRGINGGTCVQIHL